MVTTEEGGKASVFFKPDRIYMLYLFKRRRNKRSYFYTSNLSDKVTLSRQNLSE
jgi:hypothetical protein